MRDEILGILKKLSEEGVSFLVVGGFAVNIYGFNRNTGDLDILLDDTLENRRNLRNSFKQLGIGDFKQLETIPLIAGWTDISLDFGFKLDLMVNLKGLEGIPFDHLKEKATTVEIDGHFVDFIDYQNLLKTKIATNRPKDQEDVRELKKINDSAENTKKLE